MIAMTTHATEQRFKEPFSCQGHPTLPVQSATGERYCFNCIVEAFQRHMFNLVARMLSVRVSWVTSVSSRNALLVQACDV